MVNYTVIINRLNIFEGRTKRHRLYATVTSIMNRNFVSVSELSRVMAGLPILQYEPSFSKKNITTNEVGFPCILTPSCY